MKESDFEQFCEMVPSLVSDISKLMGYRNKVYRNVTELMDDKMMEKTVIILKDLKMTIRNGSKLIKMDHFQVYSYPGKSLSIIGEYWTIHPNIFHYCQILENSSKYLPKFQFCGSGKLIRFF